MKKPCDKCSCCGFVVGPPISIPSNVGTADVPVGGTANKCPKCKGTGWIDEEDFVTIPIKFVKDEYWDQNY